MDDIALVQVVVRLEDLVRDRFDPFERKSIWSRLQLLEQRLLHVVENQIQFAIFSEDVPQVYDVGVPVLAKDANLSHHCLAHVWILVLPLLELFDCHHAPGLLLLRLEDLSIRAFADNLQNTVFVHFQLIGKYDLLRGVLSGKELQEVANYDHDQILIIFRCINCHLFNKNQSNRVRSKEKKLRRPPTSPLRLFYSQQRALQVSLSGSGLKPALKVLNRGPN